MTSLNFPADPDDGQIYESFSYNATLGVWKRSGGSGSASITVSDTAPETPIAGGLWLDSTTGNTYIYYEDANTSQWIQTAGPELIANRNSEFFIQTTPPASPVDGDIWYDSSQGFTYIYYVDADSSQWIQFGLNRNGAPGTNGSNGQGVPVGGAAGQILAKTSSSNYATQWSNPISGSEAIKLNNRSISEVYSIQNNLNGLSVGPITINTSMSVTVPSGSVWAIV